AHLNCIFRAGGTPTPQEFDCSLTYNLNAATAYAGTHPPHNAGKITVLPLEAAKVETVAKLAFGTLSICWMLWRLNRESFQTETYAPNP
ncbi:hypothetical protein, partial [Microcoleus sp.]|uniref:hypothetical protein n=1 Tax=Microcoleus sp. TaxID=44472 RepID=UPI00403EAEA9